MKIRFRGWRREVYPHDVEVTPVALMGGRYRPIDGRKSLEWSNGMSAYGKVSDLALSGAFLATFEFSRAELKSWLTNFLISNPEDALKVIAEAQGDAIRYLSKAPKR